MKLKRHAQFLAAVRPAAVALSTVVCLSAHTANAETRQSIDVSASGRAASNPYLDSTKRSWSAGGTISIDPRISSSNEVTTFVLTGDFRLSQYTNRYGTDESVAVGAAVETRVNERTSVSGGLNLMSSRSGSMDVFQLGQSITPDQSQQVAPDVILPDISAVGQRSRLTRYFGRVGLTHVASPSSSIGLNLSGGYTSTNDQRGRDYAQGNLAIDYQRSLGPRTSLLSTLTIGGSDYAGTGFRDAIYVTPLVGLKTSLNENTHLTIQGGATLTRFSGGGGEHVDVAANLSLCRQWLNSSLCGSASRSAAPTAYQGVSTNTAAGVTYSLQAGRADHFSFGAHYGRTSGITAFSAALRRSTTVYGLSGDYSHDFGNRMSAFVRPSVSRNRSSTLLGSTTRTNIQVEIGIRKRFGDPS